MKKITLTLVLLIISILTNAQVLIPDSNFEGALVTYGMDTDGAVNGQISTADALAITNLSIANLGITDLTGVNEMTNLTYFSCYGNNLSTFYFQLPNLETLSIEYNNFASIDLSGVPNLTTLQIDNNSNLSSLDLSPLPLLEVVNARNCNLSTMVPNTNFPYTQVRLSNNALTANMDLTYLTNATIIDFSNNDLDGVDVTGLTNLDFLALDNCGLTDLDVTTNVNLTSLTAIGNNLTCLDLSQNTLLAGIEVNNNDPNLVIVVANVADANASTGIYQWWYKDATATYDVTCSTTAIDEIDLAERVSIYPNPAKEVFNIKVTENASYIIFDINGKLVKQGYLNNGNNSIKIGALYKGIYFVKTNLLNKTIITKIIVN